MIDLIKYVFEKTDNVWSVKGKGFIMPDEADIQKALDKAAAVLYDGDIGDRLEVGGLIVEKREKDFDVYVRVGNYR